MRYGKYWLAFAIVVLASFSILGYYGHEIYRQAPPIPNSVVSADGAVVFTKEDIQDGQNIWQSMGGQEVGTIWGHGAYVAPDWSADWLHREATYILDRWASVEQSGAKYADLSAEKQASLRARFQNEDRANTYSEETGVIQISNVRAEAVHQLTSYYSDLFSDAPAFSDLRKAYAIPELALKEPELRRKMSAFFFWTAWACGTNRPGSTITYTNNWPAEELIGNRPTSNILVWSIVSFIILLAGVGSLTWYHAFLRRKPEEELPAYPTSDPFFKLNLTPSMKATLKYFWIVTTLIVVQVLMGALTAHFGVEGEGFYGIPLAKWLPYAVTRTWHTQIGIFWIATAWLATGLFIAPAVSGVEPKFQRFGVNFLFVCLLIIVAGSMGGQWMAVQQKLGLPMNFWFGHQGYEYVDLGRFWQIFLFVGLFVWLALMGRAMWPAIQKPSENRNLLVLFLIASLAIASFYGAGLMWGQHTNLAIAEYWRWWVVHLWVEGFFEVFATVVIAFIFTRLGLLRVATATKAALLSTVIFLTGGIVGTFHHLYFTGTPTAILALGASFSALEVVPLVLIGFEAYENLALISVRTWVASYRWPIYFFVAVAFWNFVGAGLFGFLINPPIALYYMQGLNTTPVHGHAALFGVYGMLGIGLMLFCLKGLSEQREWKTCHLKFAFWAINSGLVLMIVLSLLPIGIMQTWASIEHGMWYARSADFMQLPVLNTFRWLRVVGDLVFASGILSLAWFVIGLTTGHSYSDKKASLK